MRTKLKVLCRNMEQFNIIWTIELRHAFLPKVLLDTKPTFDSTIEVARIGPLRPRSHLAARSPLSGLQVPSKSRQISTTGLLVQMW